MKPWIIMRKGIRFNKAMEERMLLIVGIAFILGSVFHTQMSLLKPYISYMFAYMTLTVALGCSSRDFKNAIKAPGLMLFMIGLLHIVLPLLAFVLAKLLMPNQPFLQAGLILGTAAPIGVSSTIWVGIAGGNIPLSLTTVIIDTILSPLIVPLVMTFTIGQSVQFDVPQLMLGLTLMIMLPTIIGIFLHDFSKGELNRKWKFFTGPTNKIMLILVIATNLAVAWDSLHLLKSAIPIVLALAFLMGSFGYLTGYGAAKLTKLSPANINTFIFTVGMRNNTAGLVMALTYFPALTAIPVVFTILFQQPLAAFSHHFLVEKRNKHEHKL